MALVNENPRRTPCHRVFQESDKDTSMSKLIAIVATAVMVDGVRTVIQPGEALPDLGEHDSLALKASGAATDPTLDARDAKAAAEMAREADDEFQAARERVQAENASIAASSDQAPPAARKAAKKS